MTQPSITFLGAAETVTGSRYLIEAKGVRILVDCGLFQGFKRLRERNWQPMPVDASSIQAVVLTHAHIDHSGYLPKLCKAGFKGPIFCSAGTRDLLEILLPDAGYLQEEDARRAARYDYSRHARPEPLFTRDDAEACLSQLRSVDFHASFAVTPLVQGLFSRAGHILGSSCVRLQIGKSSIAFSGDVGRQKDPIMRAPEPMPNADTLVVESTYGNRRHHDVDVHQALAKVINETAEKGGVIVIPSFAVGRSQHMLHIIGELRQKNLIPELPVYLDSPMAVSATELFCKHLGDHKLSEAQCAAWCDNTEYVQSPEGSKKIDKQQGPMIVISASGMATGGRVLHHLRQFLPDPKNTILFVGYQAAGTRGRALLEGIDELKIHGIYVKVQARIACLEALSAHADYVEMIAWLQKSKLAPKHVFVTHGEPSPADMLRLRLKDTFGWNVTVPEDGSRWDLNCVD